MSAGRDGSRRRGPRRVRADRPDGRGTSARGRGAGNLPERARCEGKAPGTSRSEPTATPRRPRRSNAPRRLRRPKPSASQREVPGPSLGGARRALQVVALVALLLGTTGCDNIVKYMPWFATMVDGPASETYERKPVPPPEGAVPVDGSPDYGLLEADTALTSPLDGTEEEIRRGRVVYRQFCLPCHGPEGKGRGPVVNVTGDQPRRLPFTPALDLTAGTGPGRSDGYVWGMIENGRGLMPAYERIPDEDRWHVVEYVRHLQRQARGDTAGGGGGGRP